MSARAPYLFISYRKADAGHAAGRLYSDLERDLAPGQVFLDKERLEGGDTWPERLRSEVARATVMIVLVGKRWLRVQDPRTGDRRLNVPGDWVRAEIEIGLEAVPTVVPVLVDGAAPLTVASLQTVPSIKKLAEMQPLKLRDEEWNSDTALLKKYLIARGFERRAGVENKEPSSPDVAPVEPRNGAENGEPYIVGRDEELSLLKGMMEATRSPSILNIYGPAGIGKTTLCEKLSGWCKSQQIPSARVDLYSLFYVTVPAVTCRLRDILVSGGNLHVAPWSFQEVGDAFCKFNQLVDEHGKIQSAIIHHGDITSVFDKLGFLKKPYRHSLTHPAFVRREALERYLREVDGTLAESFVHGVTSLAHSRRLVLFVDTWEKLEHNPGVEEWLSTKLLPNLPSGATAVLFGRSQAQKFASRLDVSSHLLEALSEADTKAYLRHHGLQDHKALDAVFEVTRGYPLCLALACDLSRKARGWDAVSRISVAAEAIAEELLKRLLEQEGVEDVRDFVEKGIVAEWFDRGSIRYILGVSRARADEIYQRIRGYSFVRPHPYGLQFHEGIREILRTRLEAQNKKEYTRLTKKFAAYFRKRQEGRL